MLPIDPDDALLRALRPAGDGVGSPAPDGHDGAGDIGFDPGLLGRIGRAAADLRDEPDDLAPPADPPPHLWHAIAAELGLADAGDVPSRPGEDRVDSLDSVDSLDRGAAVPRAAVRPAGTPGAEAPVIPLAPRRRANPLRWMVPVVAAAAALVAVALVVGGDDQRDVVAEVALQPLEGDGSGQATVVLLDDGGHQVEVSERFEQVPEGSYVEVWLIDPESNLERMVSLGAIKGDGTYDLPDGIDIRQYRLVDVSIEPADGVPTHSGRSILRAELPLPPA